MASPTIAVFYCAATQKPALGGHYQDGQSREDTLQRERGNKEDGLATMALRTQLTQELWSNADCDMTKTTPMRCSAMAASPMR